MAGKKRPQTVGTRVTAEEKALIIDAARSEGLTVSEFIHRLVVEGAHRRLAPRLG